MRVKPEGTVNYIRGCGYSYEEFEPLIGSIDEHFQSFINTLDIMTPDGKKVKISLFLDVFNPEKVSATAKRVSKDNAEYRVDMSAGLAYQVWVASQIFASDVDYFSWWKKVKIIDKSQSKVGKKQILADFAYYIGSYYIILHEISHIILGHCDYIADEMRFDSLDEFGTNEKELTSKELEIRYAFEAEADRQAGEFVAAFFNLSLGKYGLGNHIRFPSRSHVHEFFIYSISAVFALIQQLTGERSGIHPEPKKRQYIVASAYQKYLEDYHKNEIEALNEKFIHIMADSGKDLGIKGAGDLLEIARTALSLIRIDDIKKEISIKSYQHQVVEIGK
ncbi:hypothetical protein GNP84_19895 [Aliivibrio fischeri]|uniref:hypothetical protein n=1 Tax=Aliivibrio fischeri TaxID=668 RepID=UPI0012D8A5D9|nr:hypothetical protein [Aliivibrio fischeri]MUK79138.1 hypothetical protein [Aliivibrio fischeri]